MPHFDIIRKSEIKETFRTRSAMDTYDMQLSKVVEHFTGDLDLPEKWNIGLIVGRSGTGKTTIAKELFGNKVIERFEYTHESILDDMPKDASIQDILQTLSSVGFSSPPSWLKSYDVLSNGEKMRCDLARAILNKKDLIVFDEYTSVVDRNIAKIGSLALQKAIRKKNKKFIAVTCHYDVQEWLMPDWVFNTNDMRFRVLDAEIEKKNRPELKLEFFRTRDTQYFWSFFRRYHYLNTGIHRASQTFLCLCNGQLAGFCAILPHPGIKGRWRVHRLVILPDYQGIGIAKNFITFVAKIFADEEKKLAIVTSNRAMIYSLKSHRDWRCFHFGRLIPPKKIMKSTESSNRITASFIFRS